MGSHHIRLGLSFMLMAVLLFSSATSDTAKDKEECTEQLVGLATCLPYVGGDAKAPTPDCCSGLKQVLQTNKKCLCVIIKDRNDPELGLNINVTLALGLPSICHAPANVSQCPALLKLPPNSPEAQIFYQLGHGSNSSTSASRPVASAVKPNATDAKSTAAGGTGKSDGCGTGKRRLGVDMLVGGALVLWCFTSEFLLI